MPGLIQEPTIVGGEGDDTLVGGADAEIVHGAGGDDRIDGGAGADTLIGGEGADRLQGGLGRDVLYGGAGRDVLVFVDADDPEGVGDRLFGGAGIDTLRLEFTLEGYTEAVEAEILAYSQALVADLDPGDGGEFAFQTFALRAESIERLRLFVDGREIEPGDPPGGGAQADAFETAASEALTGDVRANDGAPEGVVTLLDDVDLGELTLNADGSFTYDPSGAFLELSDGETATQTFRYRLDDGAGRLTEASATIEILGENEAPTASDVFVSTDEDTAIDIDLLTLSEAEDVDRLDVLSVLSVEGRAVPAVEPTVVFLASGAELTIFPDGQVRYDPSGAFDELAENETGGDAFSFTIGDGEGGTVTRTVELGVTGVNDAPIAVRDEVAVLESETEFVLVAPLANDLDPEGDAFTLVDFDDLGGRILREGDFLALDAFGEFEFLAEGATEDVAFTYTIEDDFGARSVGEVVITVVGENDAPDVAPLSATTDETVPFFSFDLLTDQTDVDDGDVLRIENLQEVDTTFGGMLDGSLFTINPTVFGFLAAGESVTVDYTFDVVDEAGARVQTTFELTVDGVAGAFAAADDFFDTTEDEPIEGDVSVNDNFDPGAVFSLVDATGDGFFSFSSNGSFSYDPVGALEELDDGDVATFTFTYQIEQGGDVVEAVATIDVAGVDDAPLIVTPQVERFEAASLNVAGTEGGDDASSAPVLSADGSDVVFVSAAQNLIAGPSGMFPNVFARDLGAGATELVSGSQDAQAGGANGPSGQPSLTADGRILFISEASDIAGDPGENGAYLFDPATGETELVSVNTSGEAANGIVTGASISADGRFVVMTSEATNLDDD
ncbi:MAG: Ig-like domain-containing protein, partial [Pseudomonadota bacterium]